MFELRVSPRAPFLGVYSTGKSPQSPNTQGSPLCRVPRLKQPWVYSLEMSSMEGFQENLSCRKKNDHVSVTMDHQTPKVPGKEPVLGY